MIAFLGNFAIFNHRNRANASWTALKKCTWDFGTLRAAFSSLHGFLPLYTFHILQTSPDTHRFVATLFFPATRVKMPTTFSSLVPWVNRDQLQSSLLI